MSTTKIVIFLSLAVLSFSMSCKEAAKSEIKTERISFTKEGELQIFESANDSLLVNLDIEIAKSDYETQTGLMYRESMQENQGMLFVFSEMSVHSFYMKNTQIPLDIIFIDDTFKIASFQENAEPFDEKSLSSEVPIQYVLEINSGLVKKWGLKVGDRISYSEN